MFFASGIVDTTLFVRQPNSFDMDEILTTLSTRFPGDLESIRTIGQFRDWALAQPRLAFFEPKSVILSERGKPRLVSLSAADLNSWRRHVADGSLVRLHGLETAALSQIVADRRTAAMVLIRAHMEIAGLAAYCHEKLFDAGRDGALDRLADVVHQVYFGSSMRIQTKKTPELADYLFEEVYPIRPTDFIRSMDRFASGGDPAYTRHLLVYGLLSDFAHPVTRLAFFEILRESPEGWTLRYKLEDPLDAEAFKIAVELLLGNMRVGYACAAMLAKCEIVPSPEGGMLLRPPTPDEAGKIWLRFLETSTAGKPPAA